MRIFYETGLEFLFGITFDVGLIPGHTTIFVQQMK